MALSLTVLGCSSATPTSTRYPSAFLLRSSLLREYILIDCGEGTQIRLRKNSIRMQQIGHIFISHLHGDHFFGLFGFVFTQNLLGRKTPLHIYAHQPLEKLIKTTLAIEKTQLQYPLIFHPIKGKNSTLLDLPTLQVKAFPLKHSIRTHGFLFQEKLPPVQEQEDETQTNQVQSFAYCSDTKYMPSVAKHIQNVNMLYHETTFLKELTQTAQDKFHSTTIDAAKIAVKAHAKKLLIGHYSARYSDISPFLEEIRPIFPEVLAAKEDFKVFI